MLASNQQVAGSSPAGVTIKNNDLDSHVNPLSYVKSANSQQSANILTILR